MLNRLANILWKVNAIIAVALLTYVITAYGFTSAYGFGVYVPNIGGYFFDTTGAQ